MRSIRSFLVLVLLAAIALTVFLAALRGYRLSMDEMKSFLDAALMERAHLVAIGAPPQFTNEVVPSAGEQYSFQVFRDGLLVWRSDNAPQTPVADEPGFDYRNFGGYRWRTFTAIAEDGVTQTTVAERIDKRNALVEHAIIGAVMPVVFVLPLIVLLIWFIVGYGLSPLSRLARVLSEKHPDDLSPVPATQQPLELQQVVHSTNDLFRRLEASFERERRFAADAAHELRTPIASLKVHLHNIAAAADSRDPDLEKLDDAVDRMANIVEQMLALYRMSPDHYQAHFERLDLYQLVQDVMARMYPVFEASNIGLELTGNPASLHGDRPSLEILVKNLLDNGRKYTPPGGMVRAGVTRLETGQVELRVEDSGLGVPEEQYERIFDRFYRYGSNVGVSQAVGCGLGLPIVMHIAELHGATIQPGKSAFETGFAITLRFPYRSSVIRATRAG